MTPTSERRWRRHSSSTSASLSPTRSRISGRPGGSGRAEPCGSAAAGDGPPGATRGRAVFNPDAGGRLVLLARLVLGVARAAGKSARLDHPAPLDEIGLAGLVVAPEL